MNYYEHHIGDYAAATGHLSLVEDAVYTRMLRRYYLTEAALPADAAQLARLVGARQPDEIAAVDAVLAEFFHLQADGWHQKRADEDIERYRAKIDAARENGKRGGRPPNKPSEKGSVNSGSENKTQPKAHQAPSSSPQEDKKPSPSATQTASNDPPASELNAAKTERIRQVTADAIDAYNTQLAQPVGLLPAVRPGVGIDARMRQVRRCIKVAREICADQFGSATITRDFWTAYFGACAADPFKSGRQSPGKGHENWTPNFEYLTRESVVLEVFDRATTEASA